MGEPVEASHLSYAFGTGRLARQVLYDLHLTVHRGEIVLLTGPSGSGKTTLLTLVGALRAVQDGSCAVLGHELAGAADAVRVAIRRRIGFIFQDHRLLDFLTAVQNVATALEHDPTISEANRMRRAAVMLSCGRSGSLPASAASSTLRRSAPADRDCSRISPRSRSAVGRRTHGGIGPPKRWRGDGIGIRIGTRTWLGCADCHA